MPKTEISGDGQIWSAFSNYTFSHFGSTFEGLSFTDDALVLFGDAPAGAAPQTLPDSTAPNALIAALWSDLEIVYEAGLRGISLATAGSAVIIEYDDPVLAGTSSVVGDFEVIIYPVDHTPGYHEVVLAFDNLQNLPSPATIGLEDETGTLAAAYLNLGDPSSVLADGLMICFDWVLPTLLTDGFESGDTSGWSTAVGLAQTSGW